MLKSFARRFFFCTLLILTLCSVGCGKKSSDAVRLIISSGSGQMALPGEDFARPVQLKLVRDDGTPLAGETLNFAVSENSGLQPAVPQTVTDANGCAEIKVRAGKISGDQYLRITPVNFPQAVREVRFISGIRIDGELQESNADETLPKPISVKIVNADGTPAIGLPVYFAVKAPKGSDAELSQLRTQTNASGVASTDLKVGSVTGCYDVSISVSGKDLHYRPIVVRELGINLTKLLFNVIGGLALFIFGMKIMSGGLRNAAGERIRSILRFFAKNRVIGMIAGIGITIALQSSSATTVMLVGFINAGLMNLAQSISIMLGAHVGTTVTAQLIAFNLDSLIMPAIILGLILSFIPSQKLRGLGDTVLGFGLLFFGMKIMSSELKGIADFPSFIEFFRTFDCSPVNGKLPVGAVLGAIGIGMLVTMIIQGSSATAGIVIALGAGGLINLYTAVALVLGSNVGTTITAILASIPANRVAKQAALANTLCATIGVLIVTASFWIPCGSNGEPLFFGLLCKISGQVGEINAQDMPRYIANAHTLFNVITSLLLLPFVTPIAKLSEILLPASGKVKFQYLEPHLLRNPAIALEQTVNVLRRMLNKACKMIDKALTAYFIKNVVDEEKFNLLRKKEEKVDKLQYEITQYLTQIMQQRLSLPQAKVIPVLMHCTNDAERIADYTEDILDLTRRLHDSKRTVSKEAVAELEELSRMLSTQARCAISLLGSYDKEVVKHALELEHEILRQSEHFEDTHITRLNERSCHPEAGVVFIEMLNEIVKISARLSNIVERAGTINRSALGFRDVPVDEVTEDEE